MNHDKSNQLLTNVFMKSGAKNHLTAQYIRNLHQSLTTPKTIQNPNGEFKLSQLSNQEKTEILSYSFIKHYLQKHQLIETIGCLNEELKFPPNSESEFESAFSTLKIPNNTDPIYFLIQNQVKNSKTIKPTNAKKRNPRKSNGHIISNSNSNFSFNSDTPDTPIPKATNSTSPKNGRKRKLQNKNSYDPHLRVKNKLKKSTRKETIEPKSPTESFQEEINSSVIKITPTKRNKSTPKRARKNNNKGNLNQEINSPTNPDHQNCDFQQPKEIAKIPKRTRKANSARRPINEKNNKSPKINPQNEISKFEQNQSFKSDSQSQTESPKLHIETSMLAQKTTVLSISDSYHVTNFSSLLLNDNSPPITPRSLTVSELDPKESTVENPSFVRNQNFVVRTYGNDVGSFSDIPNRLSQIDHLDDINQSRHNIQKEINFSLDNIERVTASVRDFDVKDIDNKVIQDNSNKIENKQISHQEKEDEDVIIKVVNENTNKRPPLQIVQTNCHSQCFDSDAVKNRSSNDSNSHLHHRSQSAPHQKTSSENSRTNQDSSERKRIRVRVKKNKSPRNESVDDDKHGDRILKRVRVRRSASVNSSHHHEHDNHSDHHDKQGTLTRVRVRKNKNSGSESNKSSHRRSSSVTHNRNDDSSMIGIKLILSDKDTNEKHRKSSSRRSSSVQSHHHKSDYKDVATSTPKSSTGKRDSDITSFLSDRNISIENEDAFIHQRRSSSSSKKHNFDVSHFSSCNDNLNISQIDRNASKISNGSSKRHEFLSQSSKIEDYLSESSSSIQVNRIESSSISESYQKRRNSLNDSSKTKDNRSETSHKSTNSSKSRENRSESSHKKPNSSTDLSQNKDNRSESAHKKQDLMNDSSQYFSSRSGNGKRSKRVKTTIQIDSDIIDLDSDTKSKSSHRSKSRMLSSSIATASPITSDVPTSEYEMIQTPIKDLPNNKNSSGSNAKSKQNDKIVKRGNDYLNQLFDVASSSDDESTNIKPVHVQPKRMNYSPYVNSRMGYQGDNNNDELLHSSSSKRRKIKKSTSSNNHRKLQLLDLSFSSTKHHHGSLMKYESYSSSSFLNDSHKNIDELTSSSFISSKNNSNYNHHSISRRSISDEYDTSKEMYQLSPEADEGILIDLSSPAERRSRSSSRSSQRNEIKQEYKLRIVQVKNLPKHNRPVGCLITIDEDKEFTTERKEGEIIVLNKEYQFIGSPSTVISIYAITDDHDDNLATFSAPISQFKLTVNQWCEMKPEGIAQVVIEQLTSTLSTPR